MNSTLQIRTVLIPVDGSGHSRKAALIGAMIAAKFRARVILLHVLLRGAPANKIYELGREHKISPDALGKFRSLTPPIYDFGLTVPAGIVGPVAPTDLLIEIGRRILETEKGVIEGQGVEALELVIADDDPADKILEIAKKESADFVVMGRRGHGTLAGMLSGSVSTKVSHLCSASVISVT